MGAILWVRGNGFSRRCDVRCWQSRAPDCDCCCSGLFHAAGYSHSGAEDWVRATMTDLLWLWRLAELRGDARILFARPDLLSSPLISRLGRKRRPLQLTLTYRR